VCGYTVVGRLELAILGLLRLTKLRYHEMRTMLTSIPLHSEGQTTVSLIKGGYGVLCAVYSFGIIQMLKE